MPTTHLYCTFRVGGLFLGVEVLKVQEVLRYRATTRVPRAPRAIRGLINLRGQIVPAIDLRHYLALPEPQADRPPMNVVVRTDDGAMSLLVDEIGEVLDLEESAFEGPPATLAGTARALIRGTFKLE